MPDVNLSQSRARKRIKSIFLLISITWTATMAGIFLFTYKANYDSAVLAAKSAAVNTYRKDIVYRKWASVHGGVYVSASDLTPPNPYLANISDRDVETTGGKKLTLVNPEYMTRQVQELGAKDYGLKGHITSLKPMRPENSPDDWERKALTEFKNGLTEISSIEMIGSNKYFRYMEPMVVEESCLKCHAHEGYKPGDLHGGISVSVPWAEIEPSMNHTTKVDFAVYGLIWLFGLVGNFGAKRAVTSQIYKQETAMEALAKSERTLNTVLQATSVGIGLIKGRVIQWTNDAMFEQTGYSPDELVGQPSRQFYANDQEYERSGALMYSEIAAKSKSTIETRFRKKDGTLIEVLMNLSAVDKADLSQGAVFVLMDVTESRKMAHELQENIMRMERAEVAAKFGNWELDLSSRKVRGSKGALHIYGLKQDEMDLEAVQKFPLPEYRAQLDAALSALIIDRKPYDIEYKSVRPSDNKVVDIHSMADFNPGTNIIWGVIQDITERKAIGAALRENEERLSLTLEVSNAGCWEWFIDTDEVFFDERFHSMLGYEMGELPTSVTEWLPYHHQEDLAEWMSKAQEYLKGDRALYESEHRIRSKTGDWKWVFTRGKLVNVDGTESKKRFIGMVMDITERKKAETELQAASDRTIQLMKSMINGFVFFESVFDETGEFISCRHLLTNEAFERILGLNGDDVLGKTVHDYWPNPDKTWLDACHEVAVTGMPMSLDVFHEPTKKYLNCNIYRPWESNDRFCMVFEDVTEKKKAQEELMEMERKLLQSQKLESLGVLSGGIAHDFNNLLAVIIGNIELAQNNYFDPGEKEDFLERALSASMKSAGLVRQMLDYSGKGAFELNDVNLSELVDDNIDMFRMTVPKNINLKVDSIEDEMFVKADKSQIQQVIMNLLINASEAFDGKNGTIEITTGAQFCDESLISRSLLPEKPQPLDMAFIRIRDDGSGMDAETISRVFDPFFSTKFVGRGLGMSVVHGVVRGHGGAITIDSRPGGGTTITVYLPLLYRTGHAYGIHVDVKPCASSIEEKSPEKTKLSVLVVDDEQEVLDLALRQLLHLGCKTFSATNGKEALELFIKNPEIDLVILDLVMPEMGGVETFDRLKKLKPDLTLVICSGYNEEQIRDAFKSEFKPDAFVTKPYRLSALKDLLTLLTDQE